MEFNARGFAVTKSFPSNYHKEISVYESSNAMGPYLWINAERYPYTHKEGDSVTLQLSAKEATELRDRLDKVIEYLNETWETQED